MAGAYGVNPSPLAYLSSTFGPTPEQFQAPTPNPLIAKSAVTPAPTKVNKSKVVQNPFILDPVQLSKKNPFLIPLLPPNPDLFGINIPT